VIEWLLEQVEKDPTTLFRKRDLLAKSQAEFERLRKRGLLVYVQTDPEDETYPCELPCARACPKQIVEMQGRFYAVCPEESEIDPILLGEDDLHKYAFSIEKLLDEIRRANRLGGSLHRVNEDYLYLGYAAHKGRRTGFVFGFTIESNDALELSGLKRLCTDDDTLVVFSPVSAIQEVSVKRELHLQGIVQTSLKISVDFATFTFSIERLVSQLSAKEGAGLSVDRERSEVSYCGQTYPVTSRQVDFLEVLCKQPGAWVSGSEIKRRYDERLDKVKNKLPAPIGKLIQSHTVNGYRLNLP
jgi:hypothetical protein